MRLNWGSVLVKPVWNCFLTLFFEIVDKILLKHWKGNGKLKVEGI